MYLILELTPRHSRRRGIAIHMIIRFAQAKLPVQYCIDVLYIRLLLLPGSLLAAASAAAALLGLPAAAAAAAAAAAVAPLALLAGALLRAAAAAAARAVGFLLLTALALLLRLLRGCFITGIFFAHSILLNLALLRLALWFWCER
jgi:hypothetical protein